MYSSTFKNEFYIQKCRVLLLKMSFIFRNVEFYFYKLVLFLEMYSSILEISFIFRNVVLLLEISFILRNVHFNFRN